MNDILRSGVLTGGRANAEGSLKPVPKAVEEPVAGARAPQSGAAATRIRFGRFVLDLRRGSLLGDDAEIPLRPKTFEVLRHLARNPGRLVPVTWLARSHNIGTASATILQHAYLVSALELAGRSADAKRALAELQKAKPYVTISDLKKNARSTDPDFLAQQHQLYDGLRRAGLP